MPISVQEGVKFNDENFLQSVSQMAFGSGLTEGKSGGEGNIGILNGRIIKFNTKSGERANFTTKDGVTSFNEKNNSYSGDLIVNQKLQIMLDSCQELRNKLCEAARSTGIFKEEENSSFKDLLKKCGYTEKQCENFASDKSLLDRKVVAKVLNKINDTVGEDKKAGLKIWKTDVTVPGKDGKNVNLTADIKRSEIKSADKMAFDDVFGKDPNAFKAKNMCHALCDFLTEDLDEELFGITDSERDIIVTIYKNNKKMESACEKYNAGKRSLREFFKYYAPDCDISRLMFAFKVKTAENFHRIATIIDMFLNNISNKNNSDANKGLENIDIKQQAFTIEKARHELEMFRLLPLYVNDAKKSGWDNWLEDASDELLYFAMQMSSKDQEGKTSDDMKELRKKITNDVTAQLGSRHPGIVVRNEMHKRNLLDTYDKAMQSNFKFLNAH